MGIASLLPSKTFWVSSTARLLRISWLFCNETWVVIIGQVAVPDAGGWACHGCLQRMTS